MNSSLNCSLLLFNLNFSPFSYVAVIPKTNNRRYMKVHQYIIVILSSNLEDYILNYQK